MATVSEELPDDAIYQFCVNRSYWENEVKKQLTKQYVHDMPQKNNVMRTHIGTQWHNERHSLVAQDFADMAYCMKNTGMKGMTIFAEASPFNVVNEINCLALAQFSYNSDMTWSKFVSNTLAPCFGGEDEALLYMRLLSLHNKADLSGAIAEAREVAAKNSDYEIYRRWIWLQNYLFKLGQV